MTTLPGQLDLFDLPSAPAPRISAAWGEMAPVVEAPTCAQYADVVVAQVAEALAMTPADLMAPMPTAIPDTGDVLPGFYRIFLRGRSITVLRGMTGHAWHAWAREGYRVERIDDNAVGSVRFFSRRHGREVAGLVIGEDGTSMSVLVSGERCYTTIIHRSQVTSGNANLLIGNDLDNRDIGVPGGVPA